MSDVTAASAAATPSQVQAAQAAASSGASSPSSASSSSGPGLWSHGSFSFKDVLDIINPLQHIPVIGSVYRYLTGDEPSGGDRIIGDALYGGPIGFGASVVSTALLNDSQGHDIGERLLAKVFGSRDGSSDSPAATAVAVTTTSASPSSAPAAAAAVASSAGGRNPITLARPSGPNMMPLGGPSAAVPTGAHAGGQPVAAPASVGQVFHSTQPAASSAAPATPEQTFLAQTDQLQHQISNGRGANGSVISGRPIPLELSSNLLPVMPPGGHLTVVGPNGATTQVTTPTQPAATSPIAAATVPNPAAAMMAPGGAAGFTPVPAQPPAPTSPIAQKMMDALAKYQQLKQQEEQQNQQNNADPNAPNPAQKLDLAF